MPVMKAQPAGAQQPTVLQKMTMGCMMGGGVGLIIGFLGGGFQILRAGPGPRGALATLGQFMGTSAATFGFFMSIGSVIRNEADDARWRSVASRPGALRIAPSFRPRPIAQ